MHRLFFLICSKLRKIKLLKDSCIFSLYKNTTNRCKVVPSKAPEDKYVFEDGYLTYSLKTNSTHLLNLICPNKKAQTTEIKNIGTILLPHKCKAFVNNYAFESSNPTTLKIFNDTPSFFLPKVNIIVPHAYNYSFQMNLDVTKNQFKMDQEKLKITSKILGNFEIAPDHVVLATLSFTSLLLLVIFCLIFLYCFVCNTGQICPRCPRRKHTSRPYVNSLTNVSSQPNP